MPLGGIAADNNSVPVLVPGSADGSIVVSHPGHKAKKSRSSPSVSGGSIGAGDQNETFNNTLESATDRQLSLDYVSQAVRTGLPLIAIDLAVATASIISAGLAVNFLQGHAFNNGLWRQLPAWLLMQTTLLWFYQLYPGVGISAVSELRGVVKAAFNTCFALSSVNLIFGNLPRIEFAIFVSAMLCVMALLPLSRNLARILLAKTNWWGIRAILIGDCLTCDRLFEGMAKHRESGIRIRGYLCDEQVQSQVACTSRLGEWSEAPQIAREERCPMAAIASADAQRLAKRWMFQFPSLVWLDSNALCEATSNPIGAIAHRLNAPFLRMTPRAMKRALDLAIVIPGLLLLSIPMLAIATMIKIASPGPVIYGSSRMGQHGRRFRMWKFRSMVPNADDVLKERLATDTNARREWQQDQKLKQDPRIIRGIGQFLRCTSLDELPQLWNVLVGEMSLVGPRPVPPAEIAKYREHYYQYSQMWPGITGLWQVSGRNDTSFQTRVFLVQHYAANWSLWLDAWILVKTPLTVITRKGAY